MSMFDRKKPFTGESISARGNPAENYNGSNVRIKSGKSNNKRKGKSSGGSNVSRENNESKYS